MWILMGKMIYWDLVVGFRVEIVPPPGRGRLGGGLIGRNTSQHIVIFIIGVWTIKIISKTNQSIYFVGQN